MFKIFEDIQVQLLFYKYYYYKNNESLIPDIQYDVLKKVSKELSIVLHKNTKCSSCVHNMVGFSKNSPYWDRVKERLY